MDMIWNNALDWSQQVGRELLRILGALLVSAAYIAAGWFVGRYAGDYAVKMLSLRSFGRNGALMVGRLVSVICMIIALLLLFGNLGASSTGLLTFLSASTVAISLSIQDVLRNLVSGIYLLLERPFKVGDRVRVRDVTGEVQGIDVRTTLVRTDEGDLVLVPNAIMFSEILSNRSRYKARRLDFTITNVTVPVHRLEEDVARALAESEGVRKPIPAPQITGSGPDGRSVILRLMVDRDDRRESDVIERVVSALGEAKVEVSRS
jgi:small conductance mechanosensitive channel